MIATVPQADPLAVIGAPTGILMAIAVGIQFEPPGKGVAKAALVYAGRLASALAVAVVFVLIFGLTGADRTVLLLIARRGYLEARIAKPPERGDGMKPMRTLSGTSMSVPTSTLWPVTAK
jgi:hypothetical protein